MGYINAIIILGGINIIAALGVSILTGYTGLFTIGHAGFMALGGYTSAILIKVFRRALPPGACLLGGLLAGVLQPHHRLPVLSQPPARRLLRHRHPGLFRGDPPAAEQRQGDRPDQVGGAFGYSHSIHTDHVILLVVLVTVALALFFAHMFVTSQYGKNCIAISQDEVAAEMMGVNLLKTKLIALFISAFYAGVAGGLLGLFFAYLSPSFYTHHTVVQPAGRGGLWRHPVTDRALHHRLCADRGAASALVPGRVAPDCLWLFVRGGDGLPPQGLLGYVEMNFNFVNALWGKLTARKPVGGKVN